MSDDNVTNILSVDYKPELDRIAAAVERLSKVFEDYLVDLAPRATDEICKGCGLIVPGWVLSHKHSSGLICDEGIRPGVVYAKGYCGRPECNLPMPHDHFMDEAPGGEPASGRSSSGLP